MTLNFTKVIDELQLPTDALDEEENAPESNRSLWEQGASEESLALTDRVMEIVREFEPEAELRYNRHYIGLTVKRRAKNFVTFRPKKKFIKLEVKLPQTSETDAKLEASDLDMLTYDRRYQQYRIRMKADELGENEALLRDLIGEAYRRRESA